MNTGGGSVFHRQRWVIFRATLTEDRVTRTRATWARFDNTGCRYRVRRRRQGRAGRIGLELCGETRLGHGIKT